MIKSIKLYIPNFLTLSSAVLAMIAFFIVAFGDQNLNHILSLFLFCILLDFLDGYVARMLNATSIFGGFIDSFSDFLSFGFIPSFIYYAFLLRDTLFWGWIPCVFYTLAIGARLARFHVMKPNPDHFTGLPSTIASVILLLPLSLSLIFPIHIPTALLFVIPVFIGILCVSTYKTPTLKKIQWRKTFSIPLLFLLILGMTSYPVYLIFICGSCYILFSLIFSYRIRKS